MLVYHVERTNGAADTAVYRLARKQYKGNYACVQRLGFRLWGGYQPVS
jgi:hypothetical protein